MRKPLWILNSALLLLIIGALFFIFFSDVAVDSRQSIEPDPQKIFTLKEVSVFKDIKDIYENDIFETYIKPEQELETKKEVVPELPAPPVKVDPIAPSDPEPIFFEPLNLTLKGVVTIGGGADSSAIILDDKTKREAVYKVGDKIDDAQLIRIFDTKVIFVRANGQQEVFYLRERDAQTDPMFLNIDDWNGIVKKEDQNNYLVSKAMFASRVKNLSQFIDLLHLTSVYYNGKSVGCRVGDVAKDSLAFKLGLRTADIILSVADIEPISAKNRLMIYEKICELKDKESFVVRLQRGQDAYTLWYKLEDFVPSEEKRVTLPNFSTPSAAQIKEEQERLMRDKYKFAPTEEEIRRRERQNMVGFGGRPMPQRNYNFAG